MDTVKDDFLEAKLTLESFINDENNFKNIEAAGLIMVKSVNGGGRIISCGNGGSMCDAMHFAEELSGFFRERRKPVPALAVSDPSYITCTGNDLGFEHIFSRFVEAFGNTGDVLLAISTSGNSPNVINAAVSAQCAGMKVIGLTGKDGGKLASLCDVEIRAPESKYSDRTQEIHIKVIHSLIHYIESNLL